MERTGQSMPLLRREKSGLQGAAHDGTNFASKNIAVFGLDALHTVNTGKQQIADAGHMRVHNRLDVLARSNSPRPL